MHAKPPLPVVLPPPSLPDKGDAAWLNCAVLVDKPTDWTSQDVCSKLKVLLNVKKIGHAGTLDKLATGAPRCLQTPMLLEAGRRQIANVRASGVDIHAHDCARATAEAIDDHCKAGMACRCCYACSNGCF